MKTDCTKQDQTPSTILSSYCLAQFEFEKTSATKLNVKNTLLSGTEKVKDVIEAQYSIYVNSEYRSILLSEPKWHT